MRFCTYPVEQLPRFWRGSPKNTKAKMIPKSIHQIWLGDELPALVPSIITEMKDANPDHSYRLWENADIEQFLLANYGRDVTAAYDRLDPAYGAARADLLRYLIIYKLGGVYLDVKSRFTKPISHVIAGDEGYILSQWEDPTMYRHARLAHIPGGEYVICHIIAEAGHMFLKAVIERVLHNIRVFKPWHNVGRAGVLILTGPIPYTLAIHPLRPFARYRLLRRNELCLEYSAAGYAVTSHYSENHSPVVRMGKVGSLVSWAAQGLRRYSR